MVPSIMVPGSWVPPGSSTVPAYQNHGSWFLGTKHHGSWFLGTSWEYHGSCVPNITVPGSWVPSTTVLASWVPNIRVCFMLVLVPICTNLSYALNIFRFYILLIIASKKAMMDTTSVNRLYAENSSHPAAILPVFPEKPEHY